MALPLPVLLSLAQGQQQRVQNRIKSNLREVPGIASGLGSILQQTALSEDGQANVGQSVFGGALSGAAQGAALGPIGILGGALLGGTSGLSNAAQSNADFYDTKALNESFRLSSKTVDPSIFGDGGFIIGEDMLIPIQMDSDEVYVTEDMNIYDSKSSDKHENMDDDVITDLVKDNSFAFSEREELKPSDYAEDIIGYGLAYFDEEGNYDLEKVKMKDVLGDSSKKMTFSDAAKKIRNTIKTVRDNDKDADLITRITNDENKVARIPFINKLINIHEDSYNSNSQPIIPQQFGKGGKIKKYNLGGDIENEYEDIFAELDSLDERNVLDLVDTRDSSANLFDRINTRNGISALANTFAVGLQSTRVDPNLRDTRFANEMFEEISPATADQISNTGFGRANSLISNIARNNPRAAQQLAPRLFDSALSQSNNSRLNILQSNLNQRRNRFKFLNTTGNFNRAERNRADLATRGLINKKRQSLANIGTSFLNNANRTDINEFQFNRAAEGNFERNRMSILQNRINATGQRGRYQLGMNDINERRNNLRMSLLNNRTNNTQEFDDYLGEVMNEPIYDFPLGNLS